MSNHFFPKYDYIPQAAPLAPTPAEAEAQKLAAMTSDQRRDYLDRLDHAASVKAEATKEAALKAQIEQATAVSLSGNQFYHGLKQGTLKQSVTIQGDKTTVTDLRGNGGSMIGGNIAVPQALIDQLAVTVGGIQLSPQQAKDMLARGEISDRDYRAGLQEALAPYGYSFR